MADGIDNRETAKKLVDSVVAASEKRMAALKLRLEAEEDFPVVIDETDKGHGWAGHDPEVSYPRGPNRGRPVPDPRLPNEEERAGADVAAYGVGHREEAEEEAVSDGRLDKAQIVNSMAEDLTSTPELRVTVVDPADPLDLAGVDRAQIDPEKRREAAAPDPSEPILKNVDRKLGSALAKEMRLANRQMLTEINAQAVDGAVAHQEAVRGLAGSDIPGRGKASPKSKAQVPSEAERPAVSDRGKAPPPKSPLVGRVDRPDPLADIPPSAIKESPKPDPGGPTVEFTPSKELLEALRSIQFQILSQGSNRTEITQIYTFFAQIGIVPSTHLGRDGYMASDRNGGIGDFMKSTLAPEVLIQCDEDTVPPFDVFRMALRALRLERAGEPIGIIGSTYLCTSEDGLQAAAFHKEKNRNLYPPEPGEPLLMEVEWVGTGCYVITRSAIKKLIERFGYVFEMHMTKDGLKEKSVDVGLGGRLRAVGLKSYMDRSAVSAHAKEGLFVPLYDGGVRMVPWGSAWNGAAIPLQARDEKPRSQLLTEGMYLAQRELESSTNSVGSDLAPPRHLAPGVILTEQEMSYYTVIPEEQAALDRIHSIADEEGWARTELEFRNLFAATPTMLLSLARLLLYKDPRRVLDLGSGQTTRVLAAWAAGVGGRYILSLEDDEEEVKKAQKEIQGVTIAHAPLEGGWYSGPLKIGPKPYDLIVIDGPAMYANRDQGIRLGLLEHPELFNSQTAFLIDDSERPAVERLCKILASTLDLAVLHPPSVREFTVLIPRPRDGQIPSIGETVPLLKASK